MKKLSKVAGAIVAFTLIVPALAVAQSDGSSTTGAQIQALLSQINSLEQQLHSLIQSVASTSAPEMWNASSTPQNAAAGPAIGGCPDFTRDLSVGSQGSDVMQLQQMLQSDGFFSASTTGYFGQLTANALNEFQLHFNISTSSAGFFGPLTRAFIGAHCGGAQGAGEMTGSSTPFVTHPFGTSTPPVSPPMQPWMGSSTAPDWQGAGGSSTPMHPCPQGSPNSAQGAAAALFVPHVILPPFLLNPCNAPQSSSASQ